MSKWDFLIGRHRDTSSEAQERSSRAQMDQDHYSHASSSADSEATSDEILNSDSPAAMPLQPPVSLFECLLRKLRIG